MTARRVLVRAGGKTLQMPAGDQLKLQGVASNLHLSPAMEGGFCSLSAAGGTSTNVDLVLSSKGAGNIKLHNGLGGGVGVHTPSSTSTEIRTASTQANASLSLLAKGTGTLNLGDSSKPSFLSIDPGTGTQMGVTLWGDGSDNSTNLLFNDSKAFLYQNTIHGLTAELTLNTPGTLYLRGGNKVAVTGPTTFSAGVTAQTVSDSAGNLRTAINSKANTADLATVATTGDYNDLLNTPSSGSRTLKQQVFTSSGTFTPSAGLIAAGGSVEVLLVGGGAVPAAGVGGSGGCVIKRVVQTLEPVTVLVAAGRPSNTPASGNYSEFGDLRAQGGLHIGQSAGEGSGAGGRESPPIAATSGAYGFGAGGAPSISGTPKPNTGGGSPHSAYASSSGICIVTWWE